jgi:hypothetical protein
MLLIPTARSTGGTEPFIVALRRTANLGVSAKHPPQEWILDNALPTLIGQRGATSVMQSTTISNQPKFQECHRARETIRASLLPREEEPTAPNPIWLAGVVTTTRQANNSDGVPLQPQQHDIQQSATMPIQFYSPAIQHSSAV